jgi:hypothetical protein
VGINEREREGIPRTAINDELWELVKAIRSAEYCKAERNLGNAARKKGIGVIYHIRDFEELVSCVEFDWIEIKLALTNAGNIFLRASTFHLCTVLFVSWASRRSRLSIISCLCTILFVSWAYIGDLIVFHWRIIVILNLLLLLLYRWAGKAKEI